ncbi:GNAT family N-acetyltransferase [Pontibacillus yanchengensis]|uniref:GNAT family N-acetyltransferase n=2 Tax=Pontibacillus yanchengensis TaxID=462910 RepID=A0ACC7VKF3_9BACI|nr:GNAT family protein [Pontibacillus yanchengensis]MYL35742.1 GNAT family N-acetyltransferase [Pontibacillus yanchengensis]MYL55451.1 GNAT family N-acetyltransferase [Pontibacillus yanchengensis]
MLLRGKQVQLTALHKEDLDKIMEWHRNLTFLRQLDATIAQPKTKQEIEKWYEDATSGNGFLFAIRTIESETLIGFIELEGILWNQGNGWVSIAIGEESYQNNGYGTEAMELLVDFSFQECNLHRIQLTVFENNPRAIRLYEKLGFQKEGVYREFIRRDGEMWDMLLFGLLRKEWRA